MKILLAIVLLAGISSSAKPQKTRKMLLEQIAALKVYDGYLRKGYAIARNGLMLVRDIKKGELNLHGDYFKSLKAVNPRISSYSRVWDCISIQAKILSDFKASYTKLSRSQALSKGELECMRDVFENLLAECTNAIIELDEVTANSNLEMKDDERLKRIDALYNDMQATYSFVRDFSNQAKALVLSRLSERRDVQYSHNRIGIKN